MTPNTFLLILSKILLFFEFFQKICSGSHNFYARKMKRISMYGADHEEHFEKKVFENRSILVNNMCIFVFLTFLPLEHCCHQQKLKIITFLESPHLAEQNK